MATSTVEFQGQTYTFKGRPMTHAVITTRSEAKPLVEFAGSLAKAQKVATGHINRIETVKRGEALRGCYSTTWYASAIETIIVPASVS